jgi:AcrR family transcriptional regulator
MVRWSVTTSQARERLLDAAVEEALNSGIVDLSLRELAAAIGTSHRMLIYHFGSREGLLTAVVREVERRERQHLVETELTVADALRLWEHLVDPSLRTQERLFFEIYSHALLGRPGTEGFLEEAIEGWIAPIAGAMTEAGVEEATARAFARLGLAVTRGLLLDLLATGDVAGTTQAFRLYSGLVQRDIGPGETTALADLVRGTEDRSRQ